MDEDEDDDRPDSHEVDGFIVDDVASSRGNLH